MSNKIRNAMLYKVNEQQPIFSLPRPLFYLLLGLLLLPVLSTNFITKFMSWFITVLIHEMGHWLMALFVGCPGFPVISLDGHAAAFHLQQMTGLALLVWGALIFGVWQLQGHRHWCIFLALLALFYPLLAFTTIKNFFHLVSGHTAELIFAVIFFDRAIKGGIFKESERPLYAMLAWLLWWQNIYLCWSLWHSPIARQQYLSYGCFGLENDYVRIAAMFNWQLESIALLMLLVSLIIPLTGLILSWRYHSTKSCK